MKSILIAIWMAILSFFGIAHHAPTSPAATSTAAIPSTVIQHIPTPLLGACDQKPQGTACSVTQNGRAVSGVCEQVAVGRTACALLPSGTATTTPPPPPPSVLQSVPAYAITSCANKKPGTACTATINNITHSGICELAGPTTSACVLVPDATSSPVTHNPIPASVIKNIPAYALQACVGQPQGAACTATVQNAPRTGVCELVAASTTACALLPSQPQPQH